MAATAFNETVIGLTAVGAIAQFQPVQASGAPAVAAGNSIGFASMAAASGARVPLAVMGTSIAIAGAAIALGAAVEVGATVTQVVTRSTGVTIGRAVTAALNAGDQIEVFLIGN